MNFIELVYRHQAERFDSWTAFAHDHGIGAHSRQLVINLCWLNFVQEIPCAMNTKYIYSVQNSGINFWLFIRFTLLSGFLGFCSFKFLQNETDSSFLNLGKPFPLGEITVETSVANRFAKTGHNPAALHSGQPPVVGSHNVNLEQSLIFIKCL